MKTFSVEYSGDARRNHSFKVRGICQHDMLNPCWDNRQSDIPGQHWGGGIACAPCRKVAEIDRAAKSAEGSP